MGGFFFPGRSVAGGFVRLALHSLLCYPTTNNILPVNCFFFLLPPSPSFPFFFLLLLLFHKCSSLALSLSLPLPLLLFSVLQNLTKLTNPTNQPTKPPIPVGAAVGAIEVAVLQPFNYAKNSLQQGMKIEMTPAVWYRGVVPNIFNMAGCTMIQFAVGGALKSAVAGGSGSSLTPAQEMGCGLGAGFVSAAWGAPMELIMIQQQRKGKSLPATFTEVIKSGNIGRGFVGCAVREGLWTVGYLSLPSIIRKTLRDYDPVTFDTDNKARVPGEKGNRRTTNFSIAELFCPFHLFSLFFASLLNERINERINERTVRKFATNQPTNKPTNTHHSSQHLLFPRSLLCFFSPPSSQPPSSAAPSPAT